MRRPVSTTLTEHQAFVGFFSTSSPCQIATGASDCSAPKRSSKAPAPGSSSSPIQAWGSWLRAANSLRRVASSEWARAYYPQAQAGPHTDRVPRQKGLEDGVRESGLLGYDLFQLLARNQQHLPGLAYHGREVQRLGGEQVQLAHETTRLERPMVRASPAKSSITPPRLRGRRRSRRRRRPP
jgi:hypothetical protein